MSDIQFIEPAVELESGDDVVIDVESVSPSGQLCEGCAAPVESDDRFCTFCGHQRESSDVVVIDDKDDQHKYFRCENCGSEVATDPDQRSYVCPFCDSTYVAEFSPQQSGRQRPEFVIGFAVTPEQAQEKFFAWLRENTWYRPGDLKTKAVAEKQKGVYLPFWSFSMLAQSRWTANIGEYWYRRESYRDSDGKRRTRTVRETEWWPLSGNHHRYYSQYLVSGSRGLPQRDAERIKPFHLPALKRYEPYFLAGWLCEEYSIDRNQALRMCQDEFYRRERHNAASFLPGDTHSDVQVWTNFEGVNSDLCLLPVYILSYRYKDKLFRFLVNGQTGKYAGDKPVSYRRIWLLVGGIVLAVLAVVAVFVLVCGGLAALQS